jgi:hypothetical protein
LGKDTDFLSCRILLFYISSWIWHHFLSQKKFITEISLVTNRKDSDINWPPKGVKACFAFLTMFKYMYIQRKLWSLWRKYFEIIMTETIGTRQQKKNNKIVLPIYSRSAVCGGDQHRKWRCVRVWCKEMPRYSVPGAWPSASVSSYSQGTHPTFTSQSFYYETKNMDIVVHTGWIVILVVITMVFNPHYFVSA